MQNDSNRHETPDAGLNALKQRRSTPVLALHPPEPDASQLRQIVSAAIRVPDHGHLAPWRILWIPADRRVAFAEALQDCHRKTDPAVSEAALEKDARRFGGSPMLLVVISSLRPGHKVPEHEQILSGGCVCFALLQAAHALGFSGQWLTGWAAYDDGVGKLLGLADNERVLGFIHLGTAAREAPDRNRPALEDVFDSWNG